MKLYIFFGSQTGTAEDLAYDLCMEAAKRLIPVEVWALDEFNLDELVTIPLAVFIVSTTGQGEPPDNMRKFWKALMSRHLPSSTFASLNYTVFGLGDSTYADYNVVARKLFIRLKQLGANAFHIKGLGDDMHDFGYEAEYHPWCHGLWTSLQKFYPLLEGITQAEGLLPPMYAISEGNLEVEDVGEGEREGEGEGEGEEAGKAGRSRLTVLENNVLSRKYTNTRQIVLEYREFSPGDTVAIYPPNTQRNVEQLMLRMGWEDRNIEIQCNPRHPFARRSRYPRITSVKSLLTWHVDLNKPASRYFITILAHYAEGLHKEKLLEMCSKTLEGRNEYHRYVTKEHRNAVEVLWDFGSIPTIPLDYFLEAVGHSRCREFSIASAPGRLELLVSVVSYTTPFGRNIQGLCTHYLSQLGPGDKVNAEIRKGRMIMPALDTPVILVATGTGLAPLRAILHARIEKGAYRNLLFFGTRHPLHDYYFQEELEEIGRNGLARVSVAFSQSEPKRYVQDLIRDNWEIVVEFLNDQGVVLICGKHRQLVKSVKGALKICVENATNTENAEKFIKNMESNNRIYSENW